jgi:hypothetical protein
LLPLQQVGELLEHLVADEVPITERSSTQSSGLARAQSGPRRENLDPFSFGLACATPEHG